MSKNKIKVGGSYPDRMMGIPMDSAKQFVGEIAKLLATTGRIHVNFPNREACGYDVAVRDGVLEFTGPQSSVLFWSKLVMPRDLNVFLRVNTEEGKADLYGWNIARGVDGIECQDFSVEYLSRHMAQPHNRAGLFCSDVVLTVRRHPVLLMPDPPWG